MENTRFKILTLLLLSVFCLNAFSQQYCDDEVISDNAVLIKAVYNNDKDHSIKVYIDGVNDKGCCGTILANSSLAINKNSSRFVTVEVQGGGTKKILDTKTILQERNAIKEKKKPDVVEQHISQETTSSQQTNDKVVDVPNTDVKQTGKSSIEVSEVLHAFTIYTDTIAYYSNSYYNNLNSDVNRFVEAMKYMDQEHKELIHQQVAERLSDEDLQIIEEYLAEC